MFNLFQPELNENDQRAVGWAVTHRLRQEQNSVVIDIYTQTKKLEIRIFEPKYFLEFYLSCRIHIRDHCKGSQD